VEHGFCGADVRVWAQAIQQSPGDIIVQLHTLALPPGLANEAYRFQIGAYLQDTQERLPLKVDSPDQLLWLGTWQPTPAP
jgi:hypothetical protein